LSHHSRGHAGLRRIDEDKVLQSSFGPHLCEMGVAGHRRDDLVDVAW
jgi:hypothetical protein